MLLGGDAVTMRLLIQVFACSKFAGVQVQVHEHMNASMHLCGKAHASVGMDGVP